MYLFIVLFDKRVIGMSIFELGEIPIAHLKGERQTQRGSCVSGVQELYVMRSTVSYFSWFSQVL